MALDHTVLLGRSGLRVSPIALGAMTFGQELGWCADRATAAALLDTYLDAGGNFIDTADMYTGGTSETWLGELIAERGQRERIVLATKYTYSSDPANPNAGGNQRKHLMRALDASLTRLKTDFIDLYWMHTWDRLTPVEEVMRTMDDAVRAGKIRYVGLSDTPAWYAARAQTLAQWRGFEPVAALQVEYSLIERNVENEFTDLAAELGMGLVPWSPLAMGLLSGKYTPSKTGADADFGTGRLQTTSAGGDPSPGFDKLTERNFAIVAELERVADEAGASMAQLALRWLHGKPGVSSIIVGATKPAQLQDSLGALSDALTPAHIARLDAAGAPGTPFPYYMFSARQQRMINGDGPVVRHAPGSARVASADPAGGARSTQGQAA